MMLLVFLFSDVDVMRSCFAKTRAHLSHMSFFFFEFFRSMEERRCVWKNKLLEEHRGDIRLLWGTPRWKEA
jgi:hypothetical protein